MRILLVGRITELQGLAGFVYPIAGSSQVDALILGEAGEKELQGLGVSRAYIADNADPGYSDDIVEAVREILGRNSYEYIILASSRINKEAGSRIAQRIGGPAITEASSCYLEGGKPVFVRSIMAGKAISRETITPPGVVVALIGGGGKSLSSRLEAIERIRISGERRIEVIERKPKQRGSVRLEEAEIIVSVGRGFKSREDLSMAFKLAELIGAQVGCSRPIAADLKWLPEEHWVGLSGKKVRPKLYMAIGISGQPQHLAGIMDSKIIVAINKDPNAPIFKYADYGVVEDLYQLVPKLIERLSRR